MPHVQGSANAHLGFRRNITTALFLTSNPRGYWLSLPLTPLLNRLLVANLCAFFYLNPCLILLMGQRRGWKYNSLGSRLRKYGM
jgi:hypothetical protein